MSYKRKTVDVWELQANYGFHHGWETVCSESTWKEAKARKIEYCVNAPEYSYRIKLVREKIV